MIRTSDGILRVGRARGVAGVGPIPCGEGWTYVSLSNGMVARVETRIRYAFRRAQVGPTRIVRAATVWQDYEHRDYSYPVRIRWSHGWSVESEVCWVDERTDPWGGRWTPQCTRMPSRPDVAIAVCVTT